MTVAAPSLATTSVRPVRVGGFDATWLLWIAIIAVLLFLVVSPFVYLVVTSFTAERTGDFTLANYAVAWGRSRSSQSPRASFTTSSARSNRPASTAWRISASWFELGRISM